MIKVLFVCLGNICRSPMAEGVFQHLVDEAGLSHEFVVDSAGTGDWHVGEPAHRGTLQVLTEHGIDYKGRARQVTRRDFTDFDYVLAMDDSNLRHLIHIAGDEPQAEVRLFLSYANEAQRTAIREVPDPYYTGRFKEVYELVDDGARALLAQIRKQHKV